VGGANLLDGAVQGGAFEAHGHRFPLPAGTAAAEGPATLAVRPEDVKVGEGGAPLPLSARLFLGSTTEYRFRLGEVVLRGQGPALAGAAPGSALGVHFSKVRLFPRR
jgi:iron(III) transport system ATP-binding protein